MIPLLCRISVAIYICIACASSALAQSGLQITTPRTGTVVVPGQQLFIGVEATSEFQSVGILGAIVQIISTSESSKLNLTHRPFQVSLQIDPNATPGEYGFKVIGKNASSRIVESPAVWIQVKDSVTYTQLNTTFRQIDLRYRGDNLKPDIVGVLGSGNMRALIDDPDLSCSIDDESIARVVGRCTIVATGYGRATLTMQHRSVSRQVPVSVQSLSTRGDFDADGDVDLDDIEVLRGYVGDSVQVAADDRDLNGDGKIDALDLRVLTTLCTRPRCATQ